MILPILAAVVTNVVSSYFVNCYNPKTGHIENMNLFISQTNTTVESNLKPVITKTNGLYLIKFKMEDKSK